MLPTLRRRQLLSPLLVVISKLCIGGSNSADFLHNAIHGSSRDGSIEFVFAQVGINSVADTASAHHHSTRKSSGKGHAGRTRQERQAGGHARTHRRLLQEHHLPRSSNKQDDVGLNRGISE